MSSGTEPEEPPIRFKDSRKIDPVTGQARKPGGSQDQEQAAPPVADGASAPSGAGEPTLDVPDSLAGLEDEPAGVDEADGEAPIDENAQLLEERTRDLQRLSAEYANYRKRAERDRLAATEIAVGRTLGELIPVVDDLDRAKAHGDLTGALKAVADKLEGAFTKLGLVSFGAVGDPFDPAIHEAVLHDESADVTVATCTTIMRVGYRHGERLLRPAMVGVSEPSAAAPAEDTESTE